MSTTPQTMNEIDTPAMVIDLDIVRSNIQALEDFLRDKPVHARPHIKTHKTPEIALLQVGAGAHGVTCAKVGEAEAMVSGGISDVLIATQVVGPTKIERLCQLAKESRVSVEVDNPTNVADLSAAAAHHGVTLGVVVEVDVGSPRGGVIAGQSVVELARQVSDSASLELVGLMGYEGHTVAIEDPDARRTAAHEALQPLIDSKKLCEQAGLEIRQVTGGATNTFDSTGIIPGWTELQCGTYVTMDAWFRPHAGHTFRQACWVLSSVISRPRPNHALLDCGRKSLAFEPPGMPVIDDPNNLTIEVLAEEHALVAMGSGAPELQVGDKLRVTPWHGCTTFNLHDILYVLQNDKVLDIWPISARGKFT